MSKTAVINADKSVVEKQLKTFKYQSISSYDIDEDGESWEISKVEGGLEVVSNVKFSFGFNPVVKFYALFEKSKIDLNLQHKFDSLITVLEELPKIQGVNVEQRMMDSDIWFLSRRDTISQMSMNNVHGKFYEEIKQFLIEKEQEVVDPPIVIYHFWSDTLVDIEVGISVDDSVMIGNERISLSKIAKTNVVTAVHYGAYDRLPETYFGINEWMRKNRVVVTGPPWEIYLTDPSTEANPKKWETAIYFPIE
ncbi:MAG: GyrI-like domain-containing protein [Vicingaceae bacterium]|nr:GyrI-like domain-containing protein [Vicingaceae bacterium]